MIHKMDNMKSALRRHDATIHVSNGNLSFVERLLPEYSSRPKLVLHKIVSSAEKNHFDIVETDIEESQNALDVTGSPLKYSFFTDNFDDTIVVTKNNWRKEEESFLPLTKLMASNALNLCRENLDTKCPIPIFALCDSHDKERTVLIGTSDEEEWFTTIQISSEVIKKIADIKTECKNRLLIQEHLNTLFIQEHDVDIAVFSVFEIFGMKEDAIDWNTNLKNSYEGSLCIEVNTHNLLFDASICETNNKNLVAQVAVGSKNSQLNELWKQLLLLNQYLKIIEKYKGKTSSTRNSIVPLHFPDDFTTPYTEEFDKTLENLNLLLSGDRSFRNTQSDLETGGKFDDLQKCTIQHVDVKLKEHIEQLSSRPNIDFTDCLWELLIHVQDYVEMTDCLCNVYEKIAIDGFQPQLNSSHGTRFMQVISELQTQKNFSHLLVGSSPLELVTDMGFEKLTRDYLHLLMSAKLIDMHTIMQKFCRISHDEFKINLYRKRLTTLAQIHVCLDLVLFIQNHLECPSVTLRSMFERAFKQYVSDDSEIKDFTDLQQNTIYTFVAPILNTTIINEESSKGCPHIWRATLKSENEYAKFTTITYYSRANIFPPNIIDCVSEDPANEEEFLYATTARIISSKCPPIS